MKRKANQGGFQAPDGGKASANWPIKPCNLFDFFGLCINALTRYSVFIHSMPLICSPGHVGILIMSVYGTSALLKRIGTTCEK